MACACGHVKTSMFCTMLMRQNALEDTASPRQALQLQHKFRRAATSVAAPHQQIQLPELFKDSKTGIFAGIAVLQDFDSQASAPCHEMGFFGLACGWIAAYPPRQWRCVVMSMKVVAEHLSEYALTIQDKIRSFRGLCLLHVADVLH